MKGKLAFGYQIGKAGSLVGYKGKGGEQIFRGYVQQVSNPKSLAQAVVRYRLKALAAAWNSLRYVPNKAFKGQTALVSAWNMFVKLNSSLLLSIPDEFLEYSQQGHTVGLPVRVCSGDVPELLPVDTTADGVLSISASDNIKKYFWYLSSVASSVVDRSIISDKCIIPLISDTSVISSWAHVLSLKLADNGYSIVDDDIITFVACDYTGMKYWQMSYADMKSNSGLMSAFGVSKGLRNTSDPLTEFFGYPSGESGLLPDNAKYGLTVTQDWTSGEFPYNMAAVILSHKEADGTFTVNNCNSVIVAGDNASMSDYTNMINDISALQKNAASYIKSSGVILDPTTYSTKTE